MPKVAIISGKGDLPHLVAEALITIGREIVIIFIDQGIVFDWGKQYDYFTVKIGSVGKIIKILQENNVKEIVFAGSIARPDLKNIKLDALGVKLMAQIAKSKLKGDDSLLTIVYNFIEKQGFKVVAPNEVLQNLQVETGPLSIIKSSYSQDNDIELAQDILSLLGKFDIGQSIVVDNGRVLAIEAAEGTDKMLERVKDLQNKSGIFIKFKKANQNTKIDLPVIGLETIKRAYEAGLEGVVIESNAVLILDKEKVIDFANEKGLFIKAI